MSMIISLTFAIVANLNGSARSPRRYRSYYDHMNAVPVNIKLDSLITHRKIMKKSTIYVVVA